MDPVVHHSLSPYNAFDNNPVFWADPSGADAVTFTRDKDGELTMTSYQTDEQFIESKGLFTPGITLPRVDIIVYRKNRTGAGALAQMHVYLNSSFYDSFWADQRKGQWDSFQETLDYVGIFDPTGIVDGFNAILYYGRGQKANAAIAMVWILPFGDFAKVGKIAKYEKLADNVGTRAYIKEFKNTTAINTRILFNDITQGGTKKIINTPKVL